MLPGGMISESITWSLIPLMFFKISSDVSKIIPRGGSSNPSYVGLVAWHTPHLYLIIFHTSLKLTSSKVLSSKLLLF